MYWTQTLLPLSRYKDVMPSFLLPLQHLSSSHFFFLLSSLSINLFERPDIIHLPSRLFPKGKLLQRPVWPRSVSGWPTSCLPFCVRRCLLTRSRVRGPSRDGPLIVTLTPELNNNPHYGVADSSWKSWFMNMLGAEACCLSLLALRSSAGISGRHRPCASTFLSSPFPLSVLVITGTLHQETVGRSESLRYEINGSCPLRPRNKRISSIGV